MTTATKDTKNGASTIVKPVKNETAEEAAKRAEIQEYADELFAHIEDEQNDRDAILARLDESEKDADARRAQHIADERALAELGRVREIADSMSRNHTTYLNSLDNAARRLRGLAGSNTKAVRDAVQAVAKQHGITVTAEGLSQPKTERKPGDLLYPFYA
jgi:hypothetical protein